MNTLGASAGAFRPAFLINLASSAGGSLTRFALSLLLARLLMPAELGLVAIGLALVGVARIVRDLGVGVFLQRESALRQDRFSSCLGLLGVSTALLGGLLLAGGGLLSRHFGQPALQPLLAVLVLGFALSPFSLVMAALMQRDLAAARLAAVSRAGTLAHALTALGLALSGVGAMSLAWAYVANIVVCSLTCLPWRPAGLAWRPSLRGWRPVLRFGAGAMLGSGLGGLNNALPDLLLGQLGSASLVGFLGRANAAVGLFGTLVGNAANFGAVRSWADLHHRRQALGPSLLRATALLTGVGWPVLALSALFSQELVLLLYGAPWRDSAAALPPLAAVAALGLLFNHGNLALAAIGRPQLVAMPTALTLLARLAGAALFFDGRLVSFADVLLGAALLALPLQVLLMARCLGLSAVSLLACVWRSGLPCLAGVGAAALLRGSPVCAVGVALPVWLLALRLVGHELPGEILQLVRLRSTIRK